MDKELEKGIPLGMLNISRKIRPVFANLLTSLASRTTKFVKAYVSDDSAPAWLHQPVAPGPSSEMSTSVGESPVNGLRHRGGDAQPSAAAEDRVESMKDR